MSILEQVVSVSVAVLAYFAVPLLQQYITAALGKQRADLLGLLAVTAVTAVEQQSKPEPGNVKKQLAVAALQGLAERHKLKLDEASIHAAIEAAVFELKRGSITVAEAAPVQPSASN